MNYILVKDLGGKDRGLKFNQGALDVHFSKLNYTEVGASAIYATFYAGLIGNCIVKGEQPDFDLEAVCDWVDGMLENGRKEEIETVCNLFAETNAYKQRLAEITDRIRTLQVPEEETKKKKKKAS